MQSESGLLSAEAIRRLREFGPNEIVQEKSRSPLLLLLEQFRSPLVLILIVACVLSAVLGETVEAIAIAAILVLNALIGFFQEYRAENAIHALKNMTAPRATVIRDGHQVIIAAREVVPGDVLLLEAGDIVAADAEIITSSRLQVNEAVLTGESVPVEKSASDSAKTFMGTSVSAGTARTRVLQTGMKTELGHIAHLITTAETTQTPLQSQLARVGSMLLFVCLIVVAVVIGLGWIQGRPWIELLIFSISLAVAAVPEGMPAIVTVALALGVQRMAERNALIRKLPSVETLGSVSVICTDKTGTLTTGSMRVRELWGENHRTLLETAASCCDAEVGPDGGEGTGDPTEIAILLAARDRGILREEIEIKNPRVSTEPFDSDRKRMSILRADGVLYVKGAVESLLLLSNDSAERISGIKTTTEDLTASGLRVLGVARGNGAGEKNLSFVGLIGIADPPRPEAIRAIAEARSAGVRSIMITGDHPVTAAAIARELGLVLENEEILGRVHARATPEDKLKLVRQWKNQGNIVAMTGDGVNDAPALREAHIGIAMGRNGTEVTRQAADLILADDNFATIVAAIREGRGIYDNIRKAIVYLLTGNFAELIAVFGAVALGLPLPFLAAHLLWINLVTDSLPGLALIADPVSPEIMKRKPRSPQEALLGKPQWMSVVGVGSLEALIVIALFAYTLENSNLTEARSVAFTALVFSQLWRAFGARSTTQVLWKVGAFNNVWLLAVVAVTGLLQLALHFIPLTQEVFGIHPLALETWAKVLPLTLIPVTVVEVLKLVRQRKRNNESL